MGQPRIAGRGEMSEINFGNTFGPGARVGVALPMPFDAPLDYLVPDGMVLAAGDFVTVELGTRQTVGVVWGSGGQSVAQARLKALWTQVIC